MGVAVIEGILLGYLPSEGIMEIQTHEAVKVFSADGEVKSILMERPYDYVYMLNRRVLADVERGKVVGLRLAKDKKINC